MVTPVPQISVIKPVGHGGQWIVVAHYGSSATSITLARCSTEAEAIDVEVGVFLAIRGR